MTVEHLADERGQERRLAGVVARQRSGQLRRVRDHGRRGPQRARRRWRCWTGCPTPGTPASTSGRSATSATPRRWPRACRPRPGTRRRIPRASVLRAAERARAALRRARPAARHLRRRRERMPGPPPGRRWPTRARPCARATRAGRPSTTSVGLDDAGWRRFADGVARLERCRARGYEPTFHHHTATYIEAQWEIERLLELTDVGLCLDTGHLLLGRGDPVPAIRDWARGSTRCTSRTPGWRGSRRSSPRPRPSGDLARARPSARWATATSTSPAYSRRCAAIDYSGWLVVEQDVLPDPAEPGQPARDQRRNREYLRPHGL